MEQNKLAKGFLEFLENLNIDSDIKNWKYLGETKQAFGTPGGSWQGTKGFQFQNTVSSNKYILRSTPGDKSFLVIESYQIPGQLYNMKLTDSKVYNSNTGQLYESYNLTAGRGRVKRDEVLKTFNKLGYTDNLIFKLDEAKPDWEGLINSILDWGPIREKVKDKIKEEKKRIAKNISTTEASQNDLKPIIMSENIPLNQILFGPPGTGKTYNTINKAIEIINPGFNFDQDRQEIKNEFDRLIEQRNIVFTTFHQNMSYEDFIEGIKPITENGKVTYEVVPGIFKNICEIASSKVNPSFENAYEKLIKKISEKVDYFKLNTTSSSKSPFWVMVNKNTNLSMYTTENKNYQGSMTKEKLQKHANGENVFIGWEGYADGVIDYLIKECGYVSSSEKINNRNKDYVIIIDEINRGNISQIFGELITLIEEDKRTGSVESLEVTLPYSKDLFGVPPNLFIIGTMNTADRSVEALDTALRRRFSFTEMPPLYDLPELDYPIADTTGKQILVAINKRIEKLLDRDHLIGHSYFLLKEGEDAQEKLINSFYRNIIPLLQEYFFGDYAKIGAVLGKGFVAEETNETAFAEGFNQEDFSEKEIYQIIDYRENQPGNKYISDGMDFEKAITLLINKTLPKISEV